MKTVSIGPTVTAYQETGTGSPLVLIHGGMGSRTGYDDNLIAHLGDGIRAIQYDQRDSGDTVSDDQPYTMSDLAGDCAGLIDALGIGPAHVFGTSFGGMVAMRVAIEHPKSVRSLVLSSTSPGGALWKADLEEVRASNPNPASAATERTAQLAESFYTPGYLAEHPELKEDLGFAPPSPERMQRRLEVSYSHDCCDVIDQIVAPTLIVHGTDDPFVRIGLAEWMADHIQDARLVCLEGMRHAWVSEQPERAGALVREFVLAHD